MFTSLFLFFLIFKSVDFLVVDENNSQSILLEPKKLLSGRLPASFSVQKDKALMRLAIASRRLRDSYVDLGCALASCRRIIEAKNRKIDALVTGYDIFRKEIMVSRRVFDLESRVVLLCIRLLKGPEGELVPRDEFEQIRGANANMTALDLKLDQASKYLAEAYSTILKLSTAEQAAESDLDVEDLELTGNSVDSQ